MFCSTSTLSILQTLLGKQASHVILHLNCGVLRCQRISDPNGLPEACARPVHDAIARLYQLSNLERVCFHSSRLLCEYVSLTRKFEYVVLNAEL